jgi:hypothetical protein
MRPDLDLAAMAASLSASTDDHSALWGQPVRPGEWPRTGPLAALSVAALATQAAACVVAYKRDRIDWTHVADAVRDACTAADLAAVADAWRAADPVAAARVAGDAMNAALRARDSMRAATAGPRFARWLEWDAAAAAAGVTVAAWPSAIVAAAVTALDAATRPQAPDVTITA